jgi:hypothetical protein
MVCECGGGGANLMEQRAREREEAVKFYDRHLSSGALCELPMCRFSFALSQAASARSALNGKTKTLFRSHLFRMGL